MFEIYRDEYRRIWWRLVAADGVLVMRSATNFIRPRDARADLEVVCAAAKAAEIVDLTEAED